MSSSRQTSQPKVIEVVVKPDGKVAITTKGFLGSACRQASQFIRAALGMQQSEKLTEEFHVANRQSESNRLRNQS